MALNDYSDLNLAQLDALKEIGNIGSGNAASALSCMLDRPVDIAVPQIQIMDYSQVVDNLGGPEQLLVGLLLSLSGDVTGMIMFLLHKEFASQMVGALCGCELDIAAELDEMGESAIREVGNIMAASYINAIAELTSLRINLSVPSLCVDMAGSILSVPAIYYADISDKIIYIEDEFCQDANLPASHILMIPEVDALRRIMSSIGLDE